jgi:hypothetical protein
MKNLKHLIEKIDEMSESSERHHLETGKLEMFKVFRRENLNTLKKLAPLHYPELAEAFNATNDRKRRVLLCECLQLANAHELKPLFERLLNEDDPELSCCAMIGLGKLGETSPLLKVYSRVFQDGDRPTRFFLGCGLIHAQDKRGINLLISVLREEQKFYKNELHTTSFEGIIYSHIIDGILHGLLRGEPDTYSENPFEWIAWWESHGGDISSIDPTKVTSHLLEYKHDMIADIQEKRNH